MNDNPEAPSTEDSSAQGAPDLTAAAEPLLDGITQNAGRLTTIMERIKEQLKSLKQENQELVRAQEKSQERESFTLGLQTQLSALQTEFSDARNNHELMMAEHVVTQGKLELAERERADFKEAAEKIEEQLQHTKAQGQGSEEVTAFVQLHESLELLSIVSTLDDLLERIGAKVRAVVLRHDEATFNVVAQKGFLESDTDVVIEPVNWTPEGAFAEAIQSGKVTYCDDDESAKVIVALPFFDASHCMGAALIGEWRDEEGPRAEVLTRLANHVAVAMQNAHEFARSTRKLKTLEGILSLLEPS